MEEIAELEEKVRKLRARCSRHSTSSGYITTGVHAPRKKLATKAVRAGADDPFGSDSDNLSDSNAAAGVVSIDAHAGWASHVLDFGVVIMFIRFMKKSAEQMQLASVMQEL